jgi:transcriptional regulator with XRE-family HTH domain
MRVAAEIATARTAAGLSLRELARRLGVSKDTLRRAERCDPRTLSIDLVARLAEQLGLELAASLYLKGDPARDKGQLALLERLRARLPAAPLRLEVPIPIAGDARSADAALSLADGLVLIEAETHLGDVQATVRRGRAKARDLQAKRFILLLADTKHNRAVLSRHPELQVEFPEPQRACLAALNARRLPRADAIVVL